jgi:hypothetical protein
VSKPAEVTRYKLTGRLGDDVGDYDLGDELVVVVRAVVSKLSDTLDDGMVVCDAQCTVVTAAVFEDGHVPTQVVAALKRASEQQGKLAV